MLGALPFGIKLVLDCKRKFFYVNCLENSERQKICLKFYYIPIISVNIFFYIQILFYLTGIILCTNLSSWFFSSTYIIGISQVTMYILQAKCQ